MKPSQLATQLRQIAAAIDASKRPSRARVAAAVKKVLAAAMSDEEFEQFRGTLDNENDLLVTDTMVTFFIDMDSDFVTVHDVDGRASAKFQDLASAAGLTDVEWGSDALNFVIPRGHDVFLPLANEMKSGAHGPDMKALYDALQKPGEAKIFVNGAWEVDGYGGGSEYSIF